MNRRSSRNAVSFSSACTTKRFGHRELIARREAALEANAARLRSPTALRLLHGDVECGVEGDVELVECAANMDRMASGPERCQHQIDPGIDGEGRRAGGGAEDIVRRRGAG